ncbi:glycine-rich domain-containing protein 2 isoform X1 [Physcomitrium patens]|nr:glycine-rich domain-containing protein 2-like isoform X1 [Physcomitrium patens]PNR41127.1 hypothetical protein PHYPA_018530 [Physcomitrium patens]|eukprot:XP_024394182.1 glycine-rich domain-containing protein 2-like isoform X1 [Physcomitrella patens]
MAAHDGSCPVGLTPTSSGVSDCLSSSDRTVEMIQSEELSTALRINFSMDLVFAAKRQLGFLRTIDSLPCLHKGPMVLRAIRRYQKFWMPLVADSLKFDALLNVDSTGKSLLPPLDVQWIWHCHRLNPVVYRRYCIAKFGRVIDCPIFPDVASESLATERCKRLWTIVYLKEPYDVMSTFYKFPGSTSGSGQVCPVDDIDGLEELIAAVTKQSSFYYYVSQSYMWEDSSLQAAADRYKCFLHLLYKSKGRITCVPTFDIDLIWHAHQLSPVSYAKDTKALLGCIADHDGTLAERGPGSKLEKDFEDTAKLWESTYGLSYERAGCMYRNTKPVNVPPPPVSDIRTSFVIERPPSILPWDYRMADHNPTKYPILTPRHVLQVCILIKCTTAMVPNGREGGDLFVRLRTLDAYTLLKIEAPVLPFSHETQWQKLWVLQCETKTKGMVLELRYHVEGCMRTFRKTKCIGRAKLTWHELQKAPMLYHDVMFPLSAKRFNSPESKQSCQVGLEVSITPPVQAAYLLKSVPDRVTDDSGAMLSSVILRRRHNEPQSGRWISRTVLNHAGKETFVIRIRAAKGAWTSRGDRPVGVDWNERVINVHGGGWNYVSNHVGTSPEKIVGSAVPLAHELEEYKLSWALSTGDTLIVSRQLSDINWERHLEFTLKTSGRGAGLARLVNGRKQQYEVPNASPQEEEGFVTLIRYGPHTPQGKATALFNFRISAMEVVPEEDVVLVLLLCTATMRSIADFGGLSAGNDYTRRRMKENALGSKDWGSVVLENTTCHSHLAHWHWNGGHIGEEEEVDCENHSGVINSTPDWSGCDTLVSTSSRIMPTQPPTAAAAASSADKVVGGRVDFVQRAGSSQMNHHINHSKRPTSIP